jgi:hypothetical protein
MAQQRGGRPIRSICVSRKICGGMRSALGARTYARLKSVHETTRRTISDFLQLVTTAFTR